MSLENISLGEVADITKLAGFEFTKYIEYLEHGEIIALRALNLRNGSLDLSDVKYISKEVSESLPRSKLYKNDILLTYTGNGYGDCAIVKENDKYHLAPNIAKITPKKINPYYLFEFINSKYFKKQMRNFIGGSSQPTIPMKTLRILEIPFPKEETQNKIAVILSNINKKIEINKEINKNLFKLSNVINSDFIKSIDNNKQCSFIDLKELGNIVMGQSPKGESYNYDKIGLPLINGAADYENGYLKAQKYTSDPKKTCEKNDLIFCIRATIGLLVVCDQKYCLGRGVAGITNIDPIYKEYAFHLIYSSIENFKRAATGSVISGISRKDIENIDVKIPSFDEINKYHKIQKPIFFFFLNNRIEINNLIKLRDTLLPKLMSGEIDVSEINCDLE